MNDIYSFYQLISKYQIEIPVIQRDYAQGRHNPKANDVRKSIVKEMIAAASDGKKLFFDFVYGRIDGTKFIPFDGQQRLTTLFLFHKYIFEKCQSCSTCEYKSNCICNDILLRFSYATRQSSREFCEQLVLNNVIPSEEYYKIIKEEYVRKLKDSQEPEIKKKADEYVARKTDWMSCYIKNQSWFYSDWGKNPTIMGMLTMLDEIHNQLHSKGIDNYKPLAEKLTSGCSCPITFHFVDMGEHKLSDETYVKMNARGKSLTPFENFKASVEQYLENEKDENALSRLKENVDGKWLDLFWNIVNKGSEVKKLPDDTMMSFFNRHFMNVWRCWYGQNTMSENERKDLSDEETEKQNEYDRFNQQIIAEMHQYPTKNDFVSWDIYEFVLNNCGIAECLIPVFNIWDKLCKDNTIYEDCQAVWNRGEEKEKWNLYVGEKKNNRETYPSRVAFYALLRYFENESANVKTNLSQWMRIVWNIIENSTIDNPDTYLSALSLINKLSGRCHDIYDSLANHFEEFELGPRYHAQDQVQEEVVKARMIIDHNRALRVYNGNSKKADEDAPDYKTWENIIIAAETFAFFKGAIRFLYTDGDGNINWNDFDKKWCNAQNYFDQNGVKDGEEKYRSEALLLKAALFHVGDFWKHIEPQKYVFDNRPDTWKTNILLVKGWASALHQLMMGHLEIEPRDGDCLMYRNLYSTNLLNFVANHLTGSRIRWIHGHRAIYPPYYDGIMLDDDNRDGKFCRNRILSADSRITSKQKIDGLNYYKGWDINFEYKGYTFQWNTDEKVYVLENGKRKKNSDNATYYTPVRNINDSNELIEKLDCLISQAYRN